MNPDLVSVGEVVVDLVSADGGASYQPRLGGAPANLAIIAAALGARAGLVSRVGTDWLGDFVLERLAERGIDASRVRRARANTGLSVVAPEGQAPPDFVMYRDASADALIELEPGELEFIASAKTVHLGSLLPTSPHGRRAVEEILARSGDAVVSYDINLRPTAWRSDAEMREWAGRMIARAGVVKATEPELRTLGIAPEEHPETLWLVTDGGRSARIVRGGWEVRADPPVVPVVDATGAGDATLASLLTSLVLAGERPEALARGEAEELLREAVSLGSKIVRHAGATEWLPERAAR